MRKHAAGAVGLAIAWLATTACPPISVNTTPSTNQAIGDATTNLKDGLTALGKGLSQLDPVALNRLLNENAGLREQLERVTGQLNKAAGLGMIEIINRAVQIKVVTYRGGFVVDGWVDQETNKFWSGRVFEKKDFSFGDESENLMPILRESQRRFTVDRGQAWDNIARASQSFLLTKVMGYLAANTIVPGPDSQGIDLNTNFGSTSGQHKIVLRITPIAKDTAGQWSIRFHTVLIRENRDEELIRQFDLTSQGNPAAPLNAALPNVEQVLLVKVAG
jgi:hypothetical protein